MSTYTFGFAALNFLLNGQHFVDEQIMLAQFCKYLLIPAEVVAHVIDESLLDECLLLQIGNYLRIYLA